jgi:uroporphyrinogen decarboxylase
MGEDICYNHGLLISPDMVHEFLLPYYHDVVSGARARQKQKLYFFVDTDGWAGPAIPLYREVGMDGMFPFEVASGCDVVEIARTWPDLIIQGGIDKRVLAAGKEQIEAFLQHVLPPMVRRGGYAPTCDHGVPDNVPYENYMYYRRRLCELDH